MRRQHEQAQTALLAGQFATHLGSKVTSSRSEIGQRSGQESKAYKRDFVPPLTFDKTLHPLEIASNYFNIPFNFFMPPESLPPAISLAGHFMHNPLMAV